MTIAQIIEKHAEDSPNRVAIKYLDSSGIETHNYDYKDLDNLAKKSASYIINNSHYGARVVLLFPTGFELGLAILGCLYAGVTAIPVQLPKSSAQPKWEKINSIILDTDPHLILTPNPEVMGSIDSLKKLVTDTAVCEFQLPSLKSSFNSKSSKISICKNLDSLALIQYTSGSTDEPKGVMISQRNILENQKNIESKFKSDNKDIVCGWLPLFHDMGLIGNFLHPLYLGVPSILMDPSSFTTNPFFWLQTINRYGVTLSGGPNFAFELCVDRITDADISKLDLSCWRVAFVGAEPIRSNTLKQFEDKFANCGFSEQSFYPCYGLAESTLLVAGPNASECAVIESFDAKLIAQGRVNKVSIANEKTQKVTQLVGCGLPNDNTELLVVDKSNLKPVSEGSVGEIWLRGASVGDGYWNKADLTQTVFKASIPEEIEKFYLRTGDLGFIDSDQLYIYGRVKDLIIVRGVNYAPQDIEHTAQVQSNDFVKGGGAAISVEECNQEQLIVIQEITRSRGENQNFEELSDLLYRTILEQHGVEPSSIVFVRRASLPKTSSGKIRRYLIKQQFLSESLHLVAKFTFSKNLRNDLDVAEVSDCKQNDSQENISLDCVEKAVMNTWASVLNAPVESFSKEDNLFSLGADSLKVSQIVTNLHEQFNVEIPLDDLYDQPTIGAMSSLIWLAITEGNNAYEDEFEEFTV